MSESFPITAPHLPQWNPSSGLLPDLYIAVQPRAMLTFHRYAKAGQTMALLIKQSTTHRWVRHRLPAGRDGALSTYSAPYPNIVFHLAAPVVTNVRTIVAIYKYTCNT
jgi:hypothetical protein